MGSVGSKPVHFKHYSQLPLAIQKQTSPDISRSELFKVYSHQSFPGNDKSDSGFKDAGHRGEANSSGPRFLLQNVFNKEGGWGIETHLRPQGFEQVHSHKAFLPNFAIRHSYLSSSKRLASEDRSSPSLFPFVCRGDSQTVFEGCLQWRNSPVNCSAIWPIIGAPCICGSLKLGGRDPQESRHSSFGLFGRLPPSLSGQIQVNGTSCGNVGRLGVFGMARELPEVGDGTNTQVGILGPGLGYSVPNNRLAHQKSRRNKSLPDKAIKAGQLLVKRVAKRVGKTKLRQLCDSPGPSSLSKGPTLPEKVLPEKPEEKIEFRSARGLPVVVGSSRGLSKPVTQERGNAFLDHRRSGCGLGSKSKQQVSLRQMGHEPKSLALEPKRDVCRLCGNKVTGVIVTECPHFGSDRQSDSSSVHKESGRDSVLEAVRPNNPVVRVDLSAEHNDDSVPPARKPKRHCRLPVKGKVSTRVAPAATSHGGSVQTMGGSRNRSLCYKRHGSRFKVCQSRLKGWLRRVLRRLQPNLGLSDSLGISTSKHDAQGSGTSEQGKRDIHCDSATVDPVLLVSRPEDTRASTPTAHREPEGGAAGQDDGTTSTVSGQASTSGLENWGWGDQVKDWSRDEQRLLRSSWRPSTINTYSAPLKRWILWCESHGVDNKCPEGKDLARFLANLYLEKGFAYSTVMLHKSAVSTYCAPRVENLAKNFFVQQVLKAVSLAKPRPAKLPVWDVKILYEWLKSSEFPDTLFYQSRHTALILLLASGRRLHDLTLLELGDQGYAETEDTVTFWPKFGSKTDTSSHRQSGWLLMKHQDSKLCPVTNVKKLVKISETRRNQTTNVNSLFISITGDTKPASKTMISGWVRSAFKLAQIDGYSPGSIRSAVASRGWLDNRPIQEILERGNWKCVETFSKYYCRNINKPVSEDVPGLLYNNFKTM